MQLLTLQSGLGIKAKNAEKIELFVSEKKLMSIWTAEHISQVVVQLSREQTEGKGRLSFGGDGSIYIPIAPSFSYPPKLSVVLGHA